MTRRPTHTLLAAALFAAASSAALAQSGGGAASTTTSAPGKRTDTNIVTITATVESVDKASRAVTLKRPDGKSATVIAGPEVKNFDQIKAGDALNVKYVEALSLELKKGGGAPVARTEGGMAAKAKPGDKPAVAAGREVQVTADVVAVDAANKVVTLKGPQRTVELKVNNPDQLKLIKVGDQIQATYAEAFAVSLEPAKAAAPKDAPKKK